MTSVMFCGAVRTNGPDVSMYVDGLYWVYSAHIPSQISAVNVTARC